MFARSAHQGSTKVTRDIGGQSLGHNRIAQNLITGLKDPSAPSRGYFGARVGVNSPKISGGDRPDRFFASLESPQYLVAMGFDPGTRDRSVPEALSSARKSSPGGSKGWWVTLETQAVPGEKSVDLLSRDGAECEGGSNRPQLRTSPNALPTTRKVAIRFPGAQESMGRTLSKSIA